MTWNVLAAANMVLVALVLMWRGEALGARISPPDSRSASVMLGMAKFLYSRVVHRRWRAAAARGDRVLDAGGDVLHYAVAPRVQQPLGESRESPMYASESAKVRTFSIVAAILIATWSGASLAIRGEPSLTLGVALSCSARCSRCAPGTRC